MPRPKGEQFLVQKVKPKLASNLRPKWLQNGFTQLSGAGQVVNPTPEDTNLGEKILEFLKHLFGPKVNPDSGLKVKPVFGPKMKPKRVTFCLFSFCLQATSGFSFGPKTGFTFGPKTGFTFRQESGFTFRPNRCLKNSSWTRHTVLSFLGVLGSMFPLKRSRSLQKGCNEI